LRFILEQDGGTDKSIQPVTLCFTVPPEKLGLPFTGIRYCPQVFVLYFFTEPVFSIDVILLYQVRSQGVKTARKPIQVTLAVPFSASRQE
jgi:hypothetical protein